MRELRQVSAMITMVSASAHRDSEARTAASHVSFGALRRLAFGWTMSSRFCLIALADPTPIIFGS